MPERIKSGTIRLAQSSFFVPFLFVLANWQIWLGTHSFHHDTGDGLAAFKFASFVPRYWNWFESAGQPYWLDVALFRLHDPLAWLLLAPLKALPFTPLVAFGLFILLRIAILGVGVSLLMKALGFSWKIRQLGVALTLFGSIGSGTFEQLGMLDISLPFVYLSWCCLRFAQTKGRRFLAGIGLVVVHCSFGYHLLMLVPVAAAVLLTGTFAFRRELWTFFGDLAGAKLSLAIVAASILLAGASAALSSRQEGFVPILRNTEYSSSMDREGNNLSPTVYRGINLFDSSRLSTANLKCHVNAFCGEYSAKYLSIFAVLLPGEIQPWGELTGFLGRMALLLALFGIVFGRRPLNVVATVMVISTFGLSLGGQFPLWPISQKLFPPLAMVRHTHFYLSLIVLSLVVLSCLGMEALKRRPIPKTIAIVVLLAGMAWTYLTTEHLPFFIGPGAWPLTAALLGAGVPMLFVLKGTRPALGALLIAEILVFHFSYGAIYKRPVSDFQRELINRPLSRTILTRALRFYNPYGFPRSALGTAFNFPTAVEPVARLVRSKPANDEVSAEDVRVVGYPTPFVLEHTLRRRLILADKGEAFKRAFGIRPYGIFSISGKEAIPMEIEGENLRAVAVADAPTSAYLSVPFPHIAEVLVDGRPVPFTEANAFGLSFNLDSGAHDVLVRPKVATGKKVILLFYLASFLSLLQLYFAARRELNWRREVPRIPRLVLNPAH